MSRHFPKNNEYPNLNHILSLFDNKILSAIITGHLIIEALLIQLIKLKDSSTLSRANNFPAKAEACVSLGCFGEDMKEYLLMINTVRNNFAHNLGYQFTFSDAFLLVKKAGEVGIDFSDTTIFENKHSSEQWYSLEDVIQEIFQNTAMDLSFIVEEHGGEFQFS